MTIIAAVDGKRAPSPVVAVGNELATSFDETLLVLHVMEQEVFEELRASITESRGDSSPAPLSPSVRYGRRVRSDERPPATRNDGYTIDADAEPAAADIARTVAEETLEDTGNLSYRGRVGDPVEEIINESKRRDARYVLVGGRKRTPVGKAVFGSITQSVLLNSDRPVFAVPSETDDRVGDGPIIAAVDRSGRGEEVVGEAARLAEGIDRELRVVHVLGEDAYNDLRDGDENASSEDIRSAAKGIATDVAEAVTIGAECVGLSGQPGKQLVEYADQHQASFVVTGGRRRSPVGKVLFGSVTQSVILNVNCPVLTIMSDPE